MEPEVSAVAGEQLASDVGKKKKKKKYSRGLNIGQEIEKALTRGTHRFASAVEDGISKWRKERNRSAGKKRDGAIRDALKNYGRSLSEFGKEAARIPEDISASLPKINKMLRM